MFHTKHRWENTHITLNYTFQSQQWSLICGRRSYYRSNGRYYSNLKPLAINMFGSEEFVSNVIFLSSCEQTIIVMGVSELRHPHSMFQYLTRYRLWKHRTCKNTNERNEDSVHTKYIFRCIAVRSCWSVLFRSESLCLQFLLNVYKFTNVLPWNMYFSRASCIYRVYFA